MSLVDLYKKQQQDLDGFGALRDKVWADMKERHTFITASYGGAEQLPKDVKAQFSKDVDNYSLEWSTEGGTRYQDVLAQHEKQREAITGVKSEAKPKDQPKAQSDTFSDKQEKLANLIRMQKAIAAKKMQEKPKQ